MATNEYEDHNYTIFEDETEKSTQNKNEQFKGWDTIHSQNERNNINETASVILVGVPMRPYSHSGSMGLITNWPEVLTSSKERYKHCNLDGMNQPHVQMLFNVH